MTTPRRGGVDRGQVKVPNRLYMEAPGLTTYQARFVAQDAVAYARRNMPKITGEGARSLRPLYGDGFFGIGWTDDYVWYQEVGIHPFTMRRLAGKIIPMWITDLDGSEQRKNPKAKIRRTEDGRVQVLVFRRAAKMGARKNVRMPDGSPANVPQSYPGAPGRIAVRESRLPYSRPERAAGRIGGRPLTFRNVGVRWRHPGLSPRSFLHWGMIQAASLNGVPGAPIHATTEVWR